MTTAHVPARSPGLLPGGPRLDPYPERRRDDPTTPDLIAATLQDVVVNGKDAKTAVAEGQARMVEASK